MKHKFLFPLMILFILTACSALPVTNPTPESLSFVDGLDRQVVLEKPAQRIVSLAPSNTEMLFAIGAAEQVAGRDAFSDFPAEAKDLPSVGGSMGDYDLEATASLNPDLVLAGGINTPEQVKAISDLGLTVYFLANPVDLDGVYNNFRILGNLTGRTAEAETLIASLQERVSAVEKSLEGSTSKPIVFYEMDASDPTRPYTSGPGTFVDMLIGMAGGENVGKSLQSEWGQLSLEELLVADPDLILLGDAAYGETPEKVSQRPGWQQLQAVQNGKVFPFDDNLVSRPSHRLVDGLEAMAEIIK